MVSLFHCHLQSTIFPAWILELRCHQRLKPLAELLVILLCAERGSVFAPSRRKACKRWKTGPPAGWLFAPSRPTPKATESWRQDEAGKGYVGMWRNVLSACHRGEPAQPWAGTDTVKGCKKQRDQKKKLSSSSFYFQVGFAKIKALRHHSGLCLPACTTTLPLPVIQHIKCVLYLQSSASLSCGFTPGEWKNTDEQVPLEKKLLFWWSPGKKNAANAC